MYANCGPDDLIGQEKLSSIVDWVFKSLNISGSESADNADAYQKYCEKLGTQLSSTEPYERSKDVSTTSWLKVYSAIKQLIPAGQNTAKFEKMILEAAKIAESVDSIKQVEHLGHVIFRWDEKEESNSFFTVVKIFRSAEYLEIVPTFLSVTSRKDVAGLLVFRSARQSTSIKIKQRRFYITKMEIEAIIRILKKNTKKRWYGTVWNFFFKK